MSKFELAALSDTHPLIEQIKDILAKGTRQRVNTPEVGKMKKAAGIPVKDVFFSLEEGQSLTLTFRQDGDIIKVVHNSTVVPLRNVMDYENMPDFIAGIEDLALKLKGFQAKFDLKRQKQKVEVPNDPTKRKPSLKKQTEAVNLRLSELNTQIADKENVLIAKQKELDSIKGATA